MRQWAMAGTKEIHRLVAFNDAVVAIAITLLVLPLVSSAGAIGSHTVSWFIDHNRFELLAFVLSFTVIADFWWNHHRALESVKAYNAELVLGMFVWVFSIVFLPLPTELLGSTKASVGSHALYIGTMLVTALGALIQQHAITRSPGLRGEDTDGGSPTLTAALALTLLMALALVTTVVVPALGLWPLLILVLTRPLERLLARHRAA
jgi:uncharacterized membrane protein